MMSQQQVGFVAMLAMVAVFLTVVANNMNSYTAPATGFAATQAPVLAQAGVSVFCEKASGNNPYLPDVAVLRYAKSKSIVEEKTDFCVGPATLREAVCAGQEITFEQVECVGACVNGACVIS